MRAWLVLLLIPLTGCLNVNDDGFTYTGDFDIEGHLVGTSIWTNQAIMVLDGEPVHEPEPSDPIGTPGMGQSHTLELPSVDLNVEARAVDASGTLRWYLHRIDREAWEPYPAALHSDQTGQPAITAQANETVQIPIDDVGLWAIVAEGGAGRSEPFYVAIDVRWEASGTVYPQREDGDAPPSNYDDMTDTFSVSLPTTLAGVRIQSMDRGPDVQTNVDDIVVGNDVDVGLWGADRTPIACEGSSTFNSATELLETAITSLVVYDVAFAVGAMPDSCEQTTWHYENRRMVEYEAVFETGYRFVLL